MKKLLLVAAASFFSAAIFAQSETLTTPYDYYGPKELTCTEKAISFRANIRSGWQLDSFRIGYTDVVNRSTGFTTSQNYVEEDLIIEPIQLVKFENAPHSQDTYFNKNFLFPQKWLKFLIQTNQLAFDWSHKHPDTVKGLVYMEAITRPRTWDEVPGVARETFQNLRTEKGKEMATTFRW